MAGAPQPIDQQVFIPVNGGLGKTLTTSTSVSTSAAVPGAGVGQGREGLRVMFTNSGDYSACVRMGDSTVTATLDCYELLPGTTQSLGAPWQANVALYFAVISRSGVTYVNAVAGIGL